MAHRPVPSEPAPAAPRPAALLGWIIGVAVAGGLLIVVCGPPALPRALPSWEAIAAAAGAPSLPGDRPPLALLLLGLNWALWGLFAVLALSVAVSIAEVLVERFFPALAPLMGGLARRLALPVVRQAVRASLAASLVVATVPSAAAAGPGPLPAAIVRVADPRPAGIDQAWAADHGPPMEARDVSTPAAAADTVWHEVRAGDVLTAIADWYAADPLAYGRIAADNGLGDPNLLHMGQVLTIHGAVRTAPLPRDVAPPGPGERLYTVQAGDWLSTIARAAYGDMTRWPAIRERNWASIANPDLIRPGQRFVLPVVDGQPPRIGAAPRRAVVPAPPASAEPPARTEPPAPPVEPVAAPPPIVVGPNPVAAGLAEAEQQRPLPPRPEPVAAVAAVAVAPATATPTAARVEVAPAPAATPAPCADSEPAALATPIAAPVAAGGHGSQSASGAAVAPTPLPVDPLVAVLGIGGLGAVISGLAVARLRRRQRLAVGTDRELPVVMSAPTRPDPDGESGALVRDLAAQTRQRQAGVETDNRVVATARCLATLREELRIPYVAILSLVDRASWLQFRLILGGPQPLDLAAIEEALQGALCSPVEATLVHQWPTGAGHLSRLVVTCGEVAPDRRLTAGLAPPTPLVELGTTREGRLSVGLAGLAGGLLVAGRQALVALESAIFSLAVVYRPEQLAVVLLADEPFTAAFVEPAPLPHLAEPPRAATSPAAADVLAALHDEVRRRESRTSSDTRQWLLIVDRPAALDGPRLRTILRDGPAVGIYGLIALPADLPPDPALLDACQGRVITPLPDADAQALLFGGTPPADAAAPGQAWLVLEEVEPVALQLYRMAADDRRQLLALLAAGTPELDQADAAGVPAPAAPSPATTNERQAAAPAGAAEDLLAPVVPSTTSGAAAVTDPTANAAAAIEEVAEDGAAEAARSAPPPLATDPAEWTGPPPGWLGIRMLGAPQIMYQDELLNLAGKPLEFVLYLAAHRCRPVGAETIVTALWPNEGSLDTLRGRLQAAVSRAREALRVQMARIGGAADPRRLPDCILTDRGGYRLNPEAVWVDLVAVTARLERQQHLTDEQAVVVLSELLALFRPAAGQDPGAPAAEAGYPRQLFCAGHSYDWCVEYQEVYEGINYQSALWLAAAYARRREYRAAIALYRRLRELNPIDERVAEFEMLCHALTANRRGVREVMTALHEALTRELDGESVTPETMALYQGLVSGEVRPDPAAIVAQSPRPVYH
ncbi:MAG: LysM peptidoglycan-binding domain-containing protein [Chloroflexi bacterium]|nr:LysM peptidoglycan-binding domain-containing protein [Chloroflexota bacterium]